MKEIESSLRQAFPRLDMRCRDRHDIQIITAGVAVEIAPAEGGYQAKVVSLKGESNYDFETHLIATLQARSGKELVAALSQYIE